MRFRSILEIRTGIGMAQRSESADIVLTSVNDVGYRCPLTSVCYDDADQAGPGRTSPDRAERVGPGS